LRRSEGRPDKPSVDQINIGLTELNTTNRCASYGGENLNLTSAEFNVLHALLTHAGQVVDKELISKQALGRSLSAYDRSVDVHVSKIRKKFAALGGDKLIISVRGVGYQFAQNAAEPPA
jgi:DNA-binding response OmpR family regulator